MIAKGHTKKRTGNRKRFDSSLTGEKNQQGIPKSNGLFEDIFANFREELDAKHDKHERIVKISRDITIESKRVIFSLQRLTGKPETERDEIFLDAKNRLQQLTTSKWRQIAQEVRGEDPFQYIRAFSPGLQEFIEAAIFHSFLTSDHILKHCDFSSLLTFEDNASQSSKPSPEIETAPDHDLSTNPHLTDANDVITYNVTVPETEFMLGVADFTGEVMRLAINCVSSGDLETPFRLREMLQRFLQAFVSFGFVSREFGRKLAVLRQSLQKVEAACYTLQVRGSEVPKHMLADVINRLPNSSNVADHEDDDGDI